MSGGSSHDKARWLWVPVVVGPVLSLVSFVVTYVVDPLSFGDRKSIAALPAFLLAIIVLFISHNLATYREVQQASAYSDRIYEAVKDYLHVTKVGSPEVAMGYVLGRLPILREVRNTSFNLEDEADRSAEKLYETTTYEAAGTRIASWTSRGLRWKDIGDDRAVERLRSISVLATTAAGRGRCGYQYRLLSRNEPQINFILLGYTDGTSEVMFNWDFRNLGQEPTVLLSRDRDIVEMFSIQFEHLWRTSSPDHDSTATRSTSMK